MITSLDIAKFLKSNSELRTFEIRGVCSLGEVIDASLAFSNRMDLSVVKIIESNPYTLFLIPEADNITFDNAIAVSQPRTDYARVVRKFFDFQIAPSVAESAKISEASEISQGVYIGENCVIEDGVKIGEGTIINHNTVIYRKSVIGCNCYIGSNTTIGGPGFGYEVDTDGSPFRVPHLGNVIIGDHVDIGSGCSIARGTIDSTVISSHVKIDDKVFIAHNVFIDEGSFIIAGAEISGSVRIGKRVWISPEVAVINKVSIGDDALIGIGSTVTKTIEPNTVAVGSPAKQIRKRYNNDES